MVLATTTFSPMADLEHTAAQPMRRHRAIQMTAVLLYATLLAVLPLAAGASAEVTVAAVRNVAGCLGLPMIGARLFGSGLAWLPPLAMFGPTLPAAVGLSLAATTTPRRAERGEHT